MANEREVFTVLEDGSGEGLAWNAKAEGAAVAGVNNAPAVVAKKAGNYVLIPVSVDGAAAGDALPGLIAKDGSGNLKFLNVNADGELLVTSEQAGTIISDSATILGVIGTATDVIDLTLAASEDYQDVEVLASCTHPTYWEIVQVDDATETELSHFITGPGQFSFEKEFKKIKFAAGATGTQSLKLVGTQLSGKASDMNGYLAVIQKA